METIKYEQELVQLIKEKKELSNLDDQLVRTALYLANAKLHFEQFEKYASFKQCKRSTFCKEIITNTRKRLRTQYGVFIRGDQEKIPHLLKEIISGNNDAIENILELHQSTFERLHFYEEIYSKIFKILFNWGLKKEFILADFACGYNPFAYHKLPVKPKQYVAIDLSSTDMSYIQSFFSSASINGTAQAFDLLSLDFLSWAEQKKFDVSFFLKALDSLEFVKRHNSKKLLSIIKSDFFVVSFALNSIGGNVSIATSKRSWFERFCIQSNWDFEYVESPNEIYYVIRTKKM